MTEELTRFLAAENVKVFNSSPINFLSEYKLSASGGTELEKTDHAQTVCFMYKT